jgi:hypothetical protein
VFDLNANGGTVERVVVLDVELQLQPGEAPPRQMLEARLVEEVVGAVEPQNRESLGRQEDPRDGDTRPGGVVDRGGGGAPGEALQLEVAAGAENMKRFGRRLGVY